MKGQIFESPRGQMYIDAQTRDVVAVIQEDPKYAEGYFTLGLVYKAGGLKQRAAGMFRRTLEQKPAHPEAGPEHHALGSLQAAQDEAAQEPPEGGGGLLRKLFGR